MSKKIAIISTEFLESFIYNTLQELDINFDYHIFTYKNFENIKEIYNQIDDSYDGILTSGSFPAHMLHLYYPEETRPVSCFNTDDTSLYRLLLQLLHQNRALNFDRVYADIMELFGGDLTAFVEGTQAMPDMSVLSEQEFTLERMQQLEKEQFEKHLNLWKSGSTDLSITRFSSLVMPLKAAGVNVYFPYPGASYIQDVCNLLLTEIEKKELEERQPGIIVIRLTGHKHMKTYLHELDTNYLKLENMIMEIFGNTIIEFSLHRYHYGLEILTTKKEILNITDNFSRDKLMAAMKKYKTGLSFCIGYGFGTGLAHARLNALNACHEAEVKGNASYLITENDELMGPFSSKATEIFTADTHSYRDINSKLSPITVSKVMSALDSSAEKEITAQELAFRLGITKRSANRFLSTLESEGELEVAYKKRKTSRGRPESVFVRKVKKNED